MLLVHSKVTLRVSITDETSEQNVLTVHVYFGTGTVELHLEDMYSVISGHSYSCEREQCIVDARKGCAQCGARTHDPGIKSPMLYRLS